MVEGQRVNNERGLLSSLLSGWLSKKENLSRYYEDILNVKSCKSNTYIFSREDRIRTCDPLVPNQVRYRPALLPDPIKHC
jgi:hypothetical protein